MQWDHTILTYPSQSIPASIKHGDYMFHFRASLLSSNTAGFGSDTWGMESEETKGMSVDDIRQQQQLIIQGKVQVWHIQT